MSSLAIFSKGWNYSQDGPGNRLVYHLQGCNFKCPWCSNPEGMPMGGSLMVQSSSLSDGLCPHGAVHDHAIDRSKCAECRSRECVTHNRNTSIKWSRTEHEVADVAREIIASSVMFYDGGGVTFTGGEATLQLEPLKELMKILKEHGIHVALETNGSNPRFPELLPCLDYVMMDFKHHDDARHREVVGHGVGTTLENIRAAVASGIPTLVRIPLIPGFNDSDADIDAFISRLKPIDAPNFSVELLRYHEYGRVKWEECGRPYTMPPAAGIAVEDWKRWQKKISDSGLKVKNT